MAVLLGGPVILAVGAALALAVMLGDMAAIPGMTAMMMQPQAFRPVAFFGLFLMWVVMMTAMMLPTAAPMILYYARLQSFDRTRGSGWAPVFAFSAGYVLSWTGFSLFAAGLQVGLTVLSVMSPMGMKAAWGPFSALLLMAAGAYQFAPIKRACLRQCQSPTAFMMTRWRDGVWGGLSMGWRHGLFCIGCCWALMAVLFVAGVMNLRWIVAITIFVLVEKTILAGDWPRRVAGFGLIATGVWMMA